MNDLKEIFDGAFKTVLQVVSGKDEADSILREPSAFRQFPFLSILAIITGVMLLIAIVSRIIAIPFGYVIPESLESIPSCFVSILGAFLGILIPYVRSKKKEDIPIITMITVIIVLSCFTSLAINIYIISDPSIHPSILPSIHPPEILKSLPVSAFYLLYTLKIFI